MTFESNGIFVRASSGQEKTKCPECSGSRRKSFDPCLSVNIDEGVWNCHHCGWKGSLNKKTTVVERILIKPTQNIKTDLPQNIIDWFADRGISENTLEQEKIGFNNNWIQFPFYKDGEVVNIKSRTMEKGFKQEKNAEKCFYRFDAMQGMETIIITEGEMDALALVESGFRNVVSVPDGAPAKGSNPTDRKFSYLISAEEHLMGAETVILCTDSDDAGKYLRDELSRRIGREKCFRITFPLDCKDMNDVLVKYGKDKVNEIIAEAHPYPIDGVVEVKSEWMDALMINMVQEYGWKFGVFSAENFPVKHHLLKLVGKFAGQPFYGDDKMSEEVARNSMEILDDHIKFIGTQENSVTIASIMEQARLLNYRYGLNGLIIDPWNTLEHKFGDGENETNYISRVLSELTAFSKITELHIWVVAHPKKMENDVNRKPVVPSPYDISGSANWFNKADNAITIHRHRSEEDDYVGVHVHKIRFQYKNGQTGVGKLNYNVRTGKYETYIERVEENLFG